MVPASPPTATWPLKEVPRFRQPVVIPLAPDVDTLYDTESPVHAMFMPGPEQDGEPPLPPVDPALDVDEVATDVVGVLVDAMLEDSTGAGSLFTTTSSLVSTGRATGAGLGVELGLGLGFAGGLSFGLYSTAIAPSGVSVSTT